MRVGTTGAPAPAKEQGRRSFAFHVCMRKDVDVPPPPTHLDGAVVLHCAVSPMQHARAGAPDWIAMPDRAAPSGGRTP